jgi:hypothetical protein
LINKEVANLIDDIEDTICGFFGQESKWIFDLHGKQRLNCEEDLHELLEKYRELAIRLGHEYGRYDE